MKLSYVKKDGKWYILYRSTFKRYSWKYYFFLKYDLKKEKPIKFYPPFNSKKEVKQYLKGLNVHAFRKHIKKQEALYYKYQVRRFNTKVSKKVRLCLNSMVSQLPSKTKKGTSMLK